LINLYGTAGRKAVITQSIIFIIGTIIAIVASNLNYDRLKTLAIPVYISICCFVIAVSFIGIRVNGARRWLGFYNFTIQPAELLKLALILIIAFYLQARMKPDTRSGREYNLLDLVVPLILTIVPIVFILKEPDLGTAIICLLITGSVLFFMGIEKRTLGIIILSLLSVGIFGWKHLKSYQKDRVAHFLAPDIDYRGKNWQSHQSLLAIGSGGLYGSGEKLGPITQLGYLPEKNTDFALSSLAEEHGFISIFFVLGLINFIALRLFFIASNARDRFSSVVVIGVAFWISFQAIINTAMCAGLMPVVGIPFPVISYGGSSLLALLLAFGFVANIENRGER
jgi:rod shape determining protein RodA